MDQQRYGNQCGRDSRHVRAIFGLLLGALFTVGCGDNMPPPAGDAGPDIDSQPDIDARLQNSAPTIAAIADQSTPEDIPLLDLAVTVGDAETAAADLVVTAQSSDESIVAATGLALAGSGADRTLTITPEPDASGTVTITVTADDGQDTGQTSFSLEVTPVNDPPTVSMIADQSIDEDASTNALAFTVDDVEDDPATLAITVDSSDLALVPLANITVGGAGMNRTVAVAPATDASGMATITVTVTDSGGLDASDSFVITVNPVNDPPTAANDSYLGAAGTTGNVRVSIVSSVLANDSDVDGPMLSVLPQGGTANTAQGGDLTLNADGTFTYTPATGFLGSDSFTYTVTDNDPITPLTDTATATIEVSLPMIWFVDNTAAAPGDGRSSSPFRRLKSVETAPVTGMGDTILVAFGDGTSNNQNEGIVLGDNQTLTVGLVPAPPVITNLGGDAITLASGNTISGLRIEAPTGAGITGTGLTGTTTISQVSIVDAGGGGISIQNSGGSTASINNVDISTAAGAGISSNGIGNLAGNMIVVQSNGAPAIELSNSGLGLLSFNRVIANNNNGSGVILTNNTGLVGLFDVAIANSSGTGILASNTGRLTIGGAGNTVDTTGGTALDLSNSELNITLERVSASNAVRGIVLSGTTGSFAITGDGSDARNGSGGLIRSMSGRGIEISTATDVTLRSITVQGTGDDGLFGQTVTGFTLRGGQFSGNGNGTDEHGIEFRDLLGAAVIDNTSITTSSVDALRIFNSNGTLTSLDISGSSFTANSAALGNAGINLESRQSAQMNAITISGGTFANLQARGVIATATDTSLMELGATGSSFDNTRVAWDVGTSGAANMVFDFSNNPSIVNHVSSPVNVVTASSTTGGSITGTISGNTIGVAGVANSGSSTGNGVRIDIRGQAGATIAVTGNTIDEVIGRGVEAQARLGTGGLDLTLDNNDITCDAAFGLAGIFVTSNDNNPVCANIINNSAQGGPFFPGPFGGGYIVGEGDATPGIMFLQGFMTNVVTTLVNNGNTGGQMSQLGSNISAPAAACAVP